MQPQFSGSVIMKFTDEIKLAREVEELAWKLFLMMYYGSMDQFHSVFCSISFYYPSWGGRPPWGTPHLGY